MHEVKEFGVFYICKKSRFKSNETNPQKRNVEARIRPQDLKIT